ncbi:response regulator [Phaeobacter gallaeciensis]|uniref:response regulator n=1 Tax=Phaeobacter gallaeciensis TaxID=60890 RepID=UPI000BBBCB08|nr:response regulator [Phaeobacter gallaeciensis]
MKDLLIAGDHLMSDDAMAYMLSQLGPDIRIVAVGSVDQTLEQLGTDGPFDLVPLDYDIPRTSRLRGLELIQQQFPAQTVGMLSGHTDVHPLKSAIDGGAIGWPLKARSEDPLLHALRMMAAGRQFIPKRSAGRA